MSLSRIGSRNVVTVAPDATALDAVRRMVERNVGSVVVVGDGKPVGILTDRDVVLRLVAKAFDPARTRVADVMSRPLATMSDDASIADAAACMREHGVRRLPLVGAGGALVGIVALDDIVFHVARAEGDLADVIASFPVPSAGG